MKIVVMQVNDGTKAAFDAIFTMPEPDSKVY